MFGNGTDTVGGVLPTPETTKADINPHIYSGNTSLRADNIQDVYTIKALFEYIKGEFNRLDKRLDEIEKRQQEDTADIKEDIEKAKGKIIHMVKFN